MHNQKKVLIISTEPTHPTTAGNRSAILSYAELIKDLGYIVDFLFVQTYETINEDKIETQNYWGNHFYYYKTNSFYYRKRRFYQNLGKENYKVDHWYPNGLSNFVKTIQNRNTYSNIIINYIWLTKLFKKMKNVNKILFTHDVFSNRFAKTGVKWFSASPKEESKALNRCDFVLAIQDVESNYFKSICKSKVITTYSHVKIHNTIIKKNKVLLFLAGPNDYNTHGLVEFMKTEWPKIKDEFADLKLLVGGGICKRREIQNEDKSIELLGKINKLCNFFEKGDIFINPVFRGTGLKIKNIEALSYGKIVICHPHNVEGLFKENEVPIIRAANSNDYISSLKKIFDSTEETKIMKKRIRIYLEEYNAQVKFSFEQALV